MTQDSSPESLSALRALGVDGFVTIDDADYTSVRELLGKLAQIEQTTGFAP